MNLYNFYYFFYTNNGDFMEYIIVIFRTLFFYFFVVFVYRIMGKREVGELGVIDLIVSVLIAEIVAISIDNTDDSILLSVIPITLLVICQIIMAILSFKKRNIRTMFDGKPSVIINNGKIMIKEMAKQRYNLDDLLTQLRQNNISDIKDVEYAILETNGNLTTFTKDEEKNDKTFPLPIIVEGSINYEVLDLLDKDVIWLKNNIKEDLNNIFYGFYKNGSIYIIKNSDLKN